MIESVSQGNSYKVLTICFLAKCEGRSWSLGQDFLIKAYAYTYVMVFTIIYACVHFTHYTGTTISIEGTLGLYLQYLVKHSQEVFN